MLPIPKSSLPRATLLTLQLLSLLWHRGADNFTSACANLALVDVPKPENLLDWNSLRWGKI